MLVHLLMSFSVAFGSTGSASVCTGGSSSSGGRGNNMAVGKILPQEQSLFSLLPGQTVTVIVEIEGLPPGDRAVI